MKAEAIIQNLEKNIRTHFAVKGEFGAVFHYAKRQKNVVTFDLLDENQKLVDANNIFAIVGSAREICWYHGKDFWKLLNLYATIRGYLLDELTDHEMGYLVADCLNYYYRLYATMPVSLYYMH